MLPKFLILNYCKIPRIFIDRYFPYKPETKSCSWKTEKILMGHASETVGKVSFFVCNALCLNVWRVEGNLLLQFCSWLKRSRMEINLNTNYYHEVKAVLFYGYVCQENYKFWSIFSGLSHAGLIFIYIITGLQ